MENLHQVDHWTQRSSADYVYAISFAFTAQLEMQMEKEKVSRSELAAKLGKTTGRVSQVLNNPGNLGLNTMVEYAQALGLKVTVVAYDDHDPNNTKGPIDPLVFTKSWEFTQCPRDLFELSDTVNQLATQWAIKKQPRPNGIATPQEVKAVDPWNAQRPVWPQASPLQNLIYFTAQQQEAKAS